MLLFLNFVSHGKKKSVQSQLAKVIFYRSEMSPMYSVALSGFLRTLSYLKQKQIKRHQKPSDLFTKYSCCCVKAPFMFYHI